MSTSLQPQLELKKSTLFRKFPLRR
nr:unnamed protein product [Callosobruchus chinensis]CAH7752690.1 unnamed protein product [Callosobruchus chinensis]